MIDPAARTTGAGSGAPEEVVLVADPGAPLDLARRLQDQLRWEVSVTCRRLPADDLEQIRVPDDVTIGEHQVAVLVTDHARRDGLRPVVAEACADTRTGMVSLPALGIVRPGRRAAQAVERVVEELGGGRDDGTALGPFVREDGPTVRYVTAGRHGRLRMLAGVVRANRPWRLVPHLSKAFASALAILAYAILNPTIWQLAESLGGWRLALTMLLAIAIMVAWLIVAHRMWERPEDEDERDLVVLFNVATMATVLIGVVLLYPGLLAIGFLADRVVVDSAVMSSATGSPATLGQHLRVVWLVASFATVAGAVGTGFESDEAVRLAAYGQRQRDRFDRDEDDAPSRPLTLPSPRS
jgi:hypothetical protein